MSELFGYRWDLKGADADYLVNLDCAEQLRAEPAYQTLIFINCLSLDERAVGFTKREQRDLTKLQTKCEAILGENRIFAGSVDVLAQRQLYYYVKDAKLLLLLDAFCTKQVDFIVSCGRSNEPSHQTYYQLLYPTPIKRLRVENAAYVAAMQKKGDAVTVPRCVHYHLLFPTLPMAQIFTVEAKQKGYAIGLPQFDETQVLSIRLSVHRIGQLELRELTERSTELELLAEQFGGYLERLDAAYIEKRF